MREARSHMRKVVIEFDPSFYEKFGMTNTFRVAKSLEFKQILGLDFEEGIKVLIEEIEMKPGHELDDLELPEGLEILDVLKREGNRYTCLIKSTADAFMRKQMGLDWQQAKELPAISEAKKLFSADFAVIPDTPMVIAEDRAVFSFLGNKESIEIMLKLLRMLVDIKGIHFPRTGPYEYDILSSLTERQKQAITAAQRYGYYEYPRRISTQDLASKLGLTKATLIEHLRKAENALVSNVV
jgi:hypothetical protein